MTSLPTASSGRNGIGGAVMTLAIVDSSSGAASAAAMKPATVSAVAGSTSIPPIERRQLVEPIVELRHHAEVASSAADGPEQVGVVVRVDGEDLAIGGDDLGADQVVDGQPVAPNEVADAAAGRDPADAY